MKFAENLTKLRKRLNLSQENLAEICNVSRQSVSKWENGTSEPDIMTLIQLARILEVSVDTLVGNDETEDYNKKDFEERVSKKMATISDEEIRECVAGEVAVEYIQEMLSEMNEQGLDSKSMVDRLYQFTSSISE